MYIDAGISPNGQKARSIMTTIYLSSTYEDLKEYREEVYKSLRRSGYNVIAMEDYVATDRRPVDKCLADVAGADMYVGLFAFSYGYVPPPDHGNPDRLSITELEFRHAEKLGKPCLIFLVSEDTPWRPKFVDQGFKNNDIHRLRQYLLNARIVHYFSSPHELASLVQGAVVRVVEEQRKAAEEQRREQERQRSEDEAKRKTDEKFFFSYSRADSEFVLKLAADLRSTGANLWLDQLDIPAGHRWDRAVEQALKACPGLFVVLSPPSVASDNVIDEVSFGIENGKTILPILYKDCDIPFRLKRFQYIDFRVDYDNGFKRLVRTLKPVGQPPSQSSEPRRSSENEETGKIPTILDHPPQKAGSEPKPSTALRDRVFISYSHSDGYWLNKLQKFLKPLVRDNIIVVWDDTKIEAGTSWNEEIEKAVARSKVAVLLVSPEFLASDFLAIHELPLLKAAMQEGLKILWVCLSACLWQGSEIERFKPAHDPHQPLDSMTDAQQNAALVRICEFIKYAVTES